ncbi:MAG: coenzyme F420-0:L-glutamate ligase [Promethearchaeota archaeon]|nr:MAG: coenzyme F420-0:L-glutamate ligase [Candidatus Lokiarchaeota archaeon]
MNFKDDIKIIGLKKIPLIKKGDSISEIIINALDINGISLENGDIIVIAQTIISKSNGRIRNLNEIIPSERALELSKSISLKVKSQGLPVKDPKLIQAILDESKEIIKSEHVLITETNHGFICANAGIDKSNIEGEGMVTLLPENPDDDAEEIRRKLKSKTNKDIAVIISDSFGRAFRVGALGTAIGVSGIDPILDLRGKKDLFGYELQTTIIGQADSLAAAAQLVMGESDGGIPIVLIRGYTFEYNEKTTIKTILRNKEIDLFRESVDDVIIKILKNRRSYKLPFALKNVDRRMIEECIEIARWAPSAHNGQFWRYIILERGKLRESLIDKMNEKLIYDLQKNGKSKEFIKKKVEKTRNIFLETPILILLCLDTLDLEKYPNNERTQNEFLLGIQSISCSAIYLLLTFEMKKLAACWYCAPLFAKKIIKESLKLPESYIPMAFFTVGYPLKTIKAPDRKELKDIIFEPCI